MVLTEWELEAQLVVAVHPHSTSVQGVADTDGGVEASGVDSSGETVVGVVAQVDDLLLILELGDGADGTEDLLLHDLHVGADVAEDGRLDEVALVTVSLTTGLECGTLLLAGLDVAHDAVILKLADLGTLESLVVERVTDLVLGGTLLEGGQELVVDALLNEDTGTGAAALTVVVVDTKVDPADGLLDVGIVEHNVGRLAAKLKGDLLQVGSSSSLHDLATDNGRSSEGNLVNIHVRGDGGTGSLAIARDEVENTSGELGLVDELSEDEGRKGGLLGSLHDHTVTSGQRRADLPGKHEKREVPGDDLTADTDLEFQVSVVNIDSITWRGGGTYRLLAGVVEHVGLNINGLSGNLVGPAGVVPQAANDGTDISSSVANGLAVVERLDSSEKLRVLLGEVGKSVQQNRSLVRSNGLPGGPESLAGGNNGEINILLGGLADGGNDLLSRGVDDLELLLVHTLNPLAVDVPEE